MRSLWGRLWALTGVAILGLSLAIGTAGTATAQSGEERKPAQSLDPNVARDLLAAYEDLQNKRAKQGLDKLNALLQSRGDRMKPFDRASVLQIRGSAYVNLENYKAAIRDFEEALKLDALPPEQNSQLRFNVAQLHFQDENYPAAIRYLERWLLEVDSPSANAYYLLAAAHYYSDDYKKARAPIERALELSDKPERRYLELANIIYAELNLATQRASVLNRLIQLAPGEKSFWKQLAGLYSQQEGEAAQRKAFTTLEVAYRAGLIDDAADILSLAQFYSLFNNPHRGAALLEEHMKSGLIKRDVKTLELLSQLWSQAREHARAIPALREAASLADTGELSFRLGQVLLADEQNEAAEKALLAAVQKGGLKPADLAEAWLLLGTARFNQAGPGDRAQRERADQAFAEAQRFASTRGQASQWRQYVAAINDTEERQAALERQQAEAIDKASRERLKSTCRAQQLSGAELSEDCKTFLQRPDGEKPGSSENS
jgi:tetratricopeptide (TPR) repeat protein